MTLFYLTFTDPDLGTEVVLYDEDSFGTVVRMYILSDPGRLVTIVAHSAYSNSDYSFGNMVEVMNEYNISDDIPDTPRPRTPKLEQFYLNYFDVFHDFIMWVKNGGKHPMFRCGEAVMGERFRID